MQKQIELNERHARQALEAITRQATTVEHVRAQMRRLDMLASNAQRRLDETLEAILSAHDFEMPQHYNVRLSGTMLELNYDSTATEVAEKILDTNGVH
jgi:hypothetical protein